MTYVILMNFTDQGIRNVKETAERARAFQETAESQYGVKVKELFWTIGEYDLVTIVDASDEETVVALSLSLGSLGNVRTQSMRALTAEEMKVILDKMV